MSKSGIFEPGPLDPSILRLSALVLTGLLLLLLIMAFVRHDIFYWPSWEERKEAMLVPANNEAPLNNIPEGSRDAVLLLRSLGLRDYHIERQCESIIYHRIMEAALPIVFTPRSKNHVILNDCSRVPDGCDIAAEKGKIKIAVCR